MDEFDVQVRYKVPLARPASAPLPTAPGGTRPDWTSVVGRGAQLVVRSQPKPEIKLRSGPRLNSLSHDQDDWSYWSRQ